MTQTNVNSEIANKAILRPIEQVAQEKLGLDSGDLGPLWKI